MEILVKHVFANVWKKGKEIENDIEFAYGGNGCIRIYNIGTDNIDCTGDCEECFNQTVKEIR